MLKNLAADAWECVGGKKGKVDAKKMRSDAGTRTRVSWVKAKYADHLHHIGMRNRSDWNTLPDQQR